MKDIKTYVDQYVKYYEVDYNKFGTYNDAVKYVKYYMSMDFAESEEDKIAREKAIRRNERIDYLLKSQ
jgi:hypothetical protein